VESWLSPQLRFARLSSRVFQDRRFLAIQWRSLVETGAPK
jgi:hypothetical protein